MGQVIAVVSGKGGTGKTSFTALVGSALAEMGHRTLCLDCDVGLRNLDLALGMSDSALMDFTDVIAGRATLEQAAVRHPYGWPAVSADRADRAARGYPHERDERAARRGAEQVRLLSH